MQLQQCAQHRDTMVIYNGFACPLCSLIKAVKELNVDDITGVHPQDIRDQILERTADNSGIELI